MKKRKGEEEGAGKKKRREGKGRRRRNPQIFHNSSLTVHNVKKHINSKTLINPTPIIGLITL